ncbi:MAG: pantoate--beta-alanine ligase [Candidatus Thiodiazotropha sp. (ex Ctena orbiculata)]|uniref:Pantothenate synthetase n=1 Tax=Candidatus Thiodiazotropha taylori TaxID=2792791 RepID=A0A944QW50_9GAMM|nr:pantoate--beta-alanine ligase [Candidatus Thiodiazotropha taylori]PUB87424.1 MAG: pantoate--beta-alanine ligase [gamma proteobacterium symbiont of Ctena orbiculata]MBT2990679.1 pantoate--beta-alanine ligase [Candidatus Thiodiazotropha taylori]MBT2996837.1 pantoate--beta-alanine ligase [Candidatus Thiodiazotropha taylori]MBT3002070.1 pantoate--beta-alanine ligase [Candidatus Thiodiazotropha taylori]
METVCDLASLRQRINGWRGAGEKIGLVPTMGNLHEGHLALVEAARKRCDRCVVSIFVNPMQFGEGEDFASYPRTLDADQRKLEAAATDLLFTPTAATVYPQGDQAQTRVEVPGISDILCGASRPGHFVGVATIVCKLFNYVQPDLALFGEKDYQQLMVIRRMVDDLAMPIEIIGLPTVREADGLAKSSRNGYLSPAERRQAPKLYETLGATARALKSGERDYALLEAEGQEMLRSAGFTPDYYAIRRAVDLQPPDPDERDLVILAAAFMGTTRLIDNLNAA